ncbi:uncharacterized protein [Nicotiana tomentosiformis]|uniref:uncharacterized protein n=1 Tax=Nicotiana tomentosiformis TaxID=4098 RepID=UPI00388C79D8
MGKGTTQPVSSAATTSASPPPARGTPAHAEHGVAKCGAQSSGAASYFYAMRGRQSSKASLDVVICILTVQSQDVYALIHPGSTLSYVTPYVAMEFGIEPKQLHEPLSISSSVSESIIAVWAYGDYVVAVHGWDTMADLIELGMVDFDVFPDELPRIPPDKEIDFVIDVIPGMQPISIPPYIMVLTELKKLKE